MQDQSSAALEREALTRIPEILSDLLDEEGILVVEADRDDWADLRLTDSEGRDWAIQFKTTAAPGRVAELGRRFRELPEAGAIRLLIVPYMTPAGADVAARSGVNWVDLAGNANIRADDFYVHVQGRPNLFRSPGRPSSPFAPKSSRVTRAMLFDPRRWWRQRDLVEEVGLDDGSISRIVRRLVEDRLVVRDGRSYRPTDPDVMLDAWAEEYRFHGHDIVLGHASGGGVEVAREVGDGLRALGLRHAFTGLPAAWALDHFARFRLTTVYVDGDPRQALQQLDLRRVEKGANVQLVGPSDAGVFQGAATHDDLECVAPVQAYLDLCALPERAREAADHLRARRFDWNG